MLRNVKTPQILTNERACATSRLTRTPFGEDLRSRCAFRQSPSEGKRQMLYLGRHARWHSRRNLNARYLRRETRTAVLAPQRTGSPRRATALDGFPGLKHVASALAPLIKYWLPPGMTSGHAALTQSPTAGNPPAGLVHRNALAPLRLERLIQSKPFSQLK
ncbi:MAG: hypothetical protein HC862_17280 [Scytonema sp. RU_4_4]|nr:hypothetical protein [Scytonema sp. RU_4_4]